MKIGGPCYGGGCAKASCNDGEPRQCSGLPLLFGGRNWLLLLVAFFLAMSAVPLRADEMPAAFGDRIIHPPTQREYVSPAGHFSLALTNEDGWKTPKVVAQLIEIGPQGERRTRWQHVLPHEQGPRTAVVAESGTVLLADEWINVVSRYALTVIDPGGLTIAQYSAEQIFTLLGVPRRTITAHARYGVWMSELPILSADGNSVALSAGGFRLTVNLTDGGLAVSQ